MVISKASRTTALLGLIVVLLAALTALQYGWIRDLSDFERQRMERTLRASTDRFVRDLDGEFERLWYAFHVRRGRSAGEEIAADHAEWAQTFAFPELVAEVYWVAEARGERGGNGDMTERLVIERVSLEDGHLEASEWPAWLIALPAALAASAESHRGRAFHESDSFTAILDDHRIAFVVAQTQLDTKSWTVAILRRDVLGGRFLATLIADHFGGDEERVYDVTISDEAEDGRVVYASTVAGMASQLAPASPDTVQHLRDFGGALRGREEGGGRSFSVALTHRAGSLDTAVAQLRRRNLAFSFGVVLVLGASVAVLAIATRRSRNLAERQLEFVAGVSHELRTPIAGISSLSQNLADGIVQDLEQASRYGATIHKESRRLAAMVDGVLHFSAIRSGQYVYEARQLDPREVVEAALETLDAAAVRRSQLTVEVQADLPPLLGDERALQSVVRNLVSNAMKFGDAKGEIRLSVMTVDRQGATEIEVRVDDSGPGIHASELSQVFAPFFRGEAARARQIDGSGLGLSLVKEIVDAHGGHVEARSQPGNGSTFCVYLPTASAGEDSGE